MCITYGRYPRRSGSPESGFSERYRKREKERNGKRQTRTALVVVGEKNKYAPAG